MTSAPFHYVGTELETFAQARNWKSYLRQVLAPFIRGHVLEVGAGIGSSTEILCTGSESSWLCLEPDPVLVSHLTRRVEMGSLPGNCIVMQGQLSEGRRWGKFDTILYIDVLEHIERDDEELRTATDRLTEGGNLAIVAPAHQWLYAPFDAAIGHFRRYSLRQLESKAPANLKCVWAGYLDSAGILASLANRCFVPSGTPSKAAVRMWDRLLVPLSQLLDRICGYRAGKTVVVVWKKQN